MRKQLGRKWGELKHRRAPWSKKWGEGLGLGLSGPIGVYAYAIDQTSSDCTFVMMY